MIRKNPIIELLLGLINLPIVADLVKPDSCKEMKKSKGIMRNLLQKGAFVLIFLTFLSNLSFGAIKTWQLAGLGSWATPANWSGGTVPAAGDDVIINLTAAGIISNVPSISLNSLSIGGTANVTLTGTGSSVITS